MKRIALGKHLIIDYYECDNTTVNDNSLVKKLIHDIADLIDVDIVLDDYHCFTPYGITGFAIVSDSHISIHTWPEYRYTGIDIFSCKEIDVDKVMLYLKNKLNSDKFEYKVVDRQAMI